MAVKPDHFARLGPLSRLRLASEILAGYARVRWLLRAQSATEAIAILRERARRGDEPRSQPIANAIVAWRLAHAVQVTLARLPRDATCLFRSMTLLALMERRGIRSKLVIGVQPRPFAAHAWVEFDGQAVLPVADPGYERLAEL